MAIIKFKSETEDEGAFSLYKGKISSGYPDSI